MPTQDVDSDFTGEVDINQAMDLRQCLKMGKDLCRPKTERLIQVYAGRDLVSL